MSLHNYIRGKSNDYNEVMDLCFCPWP